MNPYFSKPTFSASLPHLKSSKEQEQVSITPFVQKASYAPFWIAFQEQEQMTVQSDLISRWTLTDRSLLFRREKTTRRFILSHIQHVKLKYKRLMFPLLLGGIGGFFSIVAALKDALNLWIGFGLGAVGLLLFYYGIKGRYQLEIYFKTGAVHTFFIEETGKNWKVFYEKLRRSLRR